MRLVRPFVITAAAFCFFIDGEAMTFERVAFDIEAHRGGRKVEPVDPDGLPDAAAGVGRDDLAG